MKDLDVQAKLEQIRRCACQAAHDEIARSLLHAYVGCLSDNQLCVGAIATLDDLAEVRRAFRNRLTRLAHEENRTIDLNRFVLDLMAIHPQDRRLEIQVDTLLSYLYQQLDPFVRESMVERWISRGTKASAARWLNAINDDPLLFDESLVLAYWRQNNDWRAAKLLAYRGSAIFLTHVLIELAQSCSEGWIVSKAALRAPEVSEEAWALIRRVRPATYIYLAARRNRSVTEAEALEIGLETDRETRGLAIWSIGRLRFWGVLEKIEAASPKIRELDLAKMTSAVHKDLER